MDPRALADLIQGVVPDADVHATDLNGTGDHWFCVVVAESFEGSRSFQRQRPLLAAATPHFQSGAIHALDLKCITPQELEEKHGGELPKPFHPHAGGTPGMHKH
ncbi:MAG: BolA/IbaG family iron-sulfur metabolism protein [Thermoplasmatota archaeon]